MNSVSSTADIPCVDGTPRHIAIIMDGNGRWATKRHLPRAAGHLRGVKAVRKIVEACAARGVSYLSLFAFSSENWRRPPQEVSMLMRLFVSSLEKEVDQLVAQSVRLRVVGELGAFDPKLRALIQAAEAKTAHGSALVLTIAANYGGRWDILQATRQMLAREPALAQDPSKITEAQLSPYLAMAYAPEPDLFIRTGGEQRISNFFIWQLAYTELYFTDVWWPDFDAAELDCALGWYRARERRFGRTSEQLAKGRAS